MNRTLGIILGSILALFIFIGVTLVASYISANNYGAKIEATVEAQWTNNKNILAQYQQKVMEVAQVPSMYKDDMKEIVSAVMGGRYGADGSKAMFQWIQEKQPNIDSSVYTKIQQVTESGRKDFEIGQTKLIDIKAQYEMNQNYAWRGLWLKIAGYPKKDISKMNIITTSRTEGVFEKGIEDSPIKLR